MSRRRRLDWAIGIYRGSSPLDLHPDSSIPNPVLTARDVTDTAADFVADPFLFHAGGRGGRWHLFFELLARNAGRGEIGWAESADARRWTYRQVVLREPFHLSYPYVFTWQGDLYMTPEGLDAGAVRLYRAASPHCPTTWEPVATLVEGRLADPTVIAHDGHWYLFACPTPASHDELRLFVAPALFGPWSEHPASPLVADDRRSARPAGRPVVHEGSWLRFAQDCHPVYGSRVRAFRIAELTPHCYAESPCAPDPVLAPAGPGWNAGRMHHVDAQLDDATGGWIACVDGCAEAPEPGEEC